jgi:alpha-L-fucosidase 2
MICFWARLADAEKAYESVVGLERTLTRENLLTISPEGIAGAPYDIFIYDGNEAGGAGIAEMLVQSHEGYIELLPALPDEWADGHFRGLCVRGGAEIDARWRGGRVVEAVLRATATGNFAVKLPDTGKIITFELEKGETRQIVPLKN